MTDIATQRYTDCTPDEMGDQLQIHVTARSGYGWTARVAWSTTDTTTGYDAAGYGPTIEAALAAAMGNLSSDELDDEL